MKTMFNVDGVCRGMKMQFGFALLLLILSPILSYWIYTLVGGVTFLGFPIAHVWFVLLFQLLVAYLITKYYKQKMKLSYGKHLQIHLCAWIAPLMAFMINYNYTSAYDIASVYVWFNVLYVYFIVRTGMNFWENAKNEYDATK